MNKKHCNALLPLVQLLPAVAAAAAVLFALPRTVPVLAAVPERLTAVVEQPAEAASSEAEEEVLPKLPYADGVYVGSSRGYGGAVRVQVTMENGSITEVEILGASQETKQFLRRAKRLLTTVVEAQSWEVDAVSEATYTSRGILGAVQNALTGEVVNNPLPPQPEPAAPLVVEEFTAPSTYLDGIYTAEYFPNLSTSLLYGKGFESHLQRIEQSRHCTRTCNIHLVLTLKSFNKSHIDNLAVKPLKRKKHNCKFRCVRRINVLIMNILCLALYTLNKCFLCRFNALLVTAFNRITESRICIARKFGINRQIYCAGTVSRQLDCKLNNIF